MKKGIVILLCITLAAGILNGCAAQGSVGQKNAGQGNAADRTKVSHEFTEANTRFAFDLLKQLDQEDAQQNIFMSPLSVSAALGMAYQGAAGATRQAMADALGYSSIADVELSDSYRNLIAHLNALDDQVELNISNSVWVRAGETINPDFVTANRDIFYADVTPLDYAREDAAAQINRWISDATNKKIDKMIEAPIPPEVIMYLINAIYFKGDWTEQFDPQHTFQSKFQAGDGSAHQIMMMSKSSKAEYGQGQDYKAVRLPYGNGKAVMYCILPDEDVAITDFIATLNNGRWHEICDSLTERSKVLVQLPRFKLEYGIKDLNNSLAALGMGKAFGEQADFSGIRENIYISKVLHKAVIEVNEKGSEAAAATSVEMTLTAEIAPPEFIADRPFVFVIADDETGTILFMGKLYTAQ